MLERTRWEAPRLDATAASLSLLLCLFSLTVLLDLTHLTGIQRLAVIDGCLGRLGVAMVVVVDIVVGVWLDVAARVVVALVACGLGSFGICNTETVTKKV